MEKKQKCFVIMPFGETLSKSEDDWTDHFENFIKPAVELSATDDNDPLNFVAERTNLVGGNMIASVFDKITSSDILLAELTDFNPNVMYELGIRHTLNNRSILIIKKGQPIPFYFTNYKIIEYSDSSFGDFQEFRRDVNRRLKELVNDSSDYDNPVFDHFKRKGQIIKISNQDNLELNLDYLIESGISNLYLPINNQLRNIAKSYAIRNSNKNIRLMASTGHSFLSNIGSRFKQEITKKLDNGAATFEVILLNPFSDNGLSIALGELPKKNMTSLQETVFEKMEQGQLVGFNSLELLEQSNYWEKFQQSLKGYIDLYETYPEQIKLRFTDEKIIATILSTEYCGFFEPYIHVNLQERIKNLMLTFEIEFTQTSHLHKHCDDYFDKVWNLGSDYSEFEKNKNSLKLKFEKKYT